MKKWRESEASLETVQTLFITKVKLNITFKPEKSEDYWYIWGANVLKISISTSESDDRRKNRKFIIFQLLPLGQSIRLFFSPCCSLINSLCETERKVEKGISLLAGIAGKQRSPLLPVNGQRQRERRKKYSTYKTICLLS